jgi:hypothetical protein
MHLAQTVTNFATLIQCNYSDRVEIYEAYIPSLDQQQIIDLLSYCVHLNRYAEGMHLEPLVVKDIEDRCFAELTERAVREPF